MSKPKLYALMVGINNYHPSSNVAPLYGCKNDIVNFHAFLKDHYSNNYTINTKTLFDEAASYQNIVDHFGEQFLLQANKEDTVLFYYSGHGAQERTAQEFLPYSPTGKEETIVCYDSRTLKGLDLADKELRVLLHRIGQQCPNIIVIMDCCHSGTATRSANNRQGMRTRQAYFRDKARPYSTYLNGFYEDNYPNGENINELSTPHILLAACDKRQKALELASNNGLFSSQLLRVLKADRHQSYSDLFSKTRIAMREIVEEQHPQFDIIGNFNPNRLFLATETTASKNRRSVYFSSNGNWEVEAGALHGLAVNANAPILYHIYDDHQQIGTAKVRSVGIQTSQLELIDVQANPSKTYQGELLSLPAAGIPFLVQADEAGEARLKAALEHYQPLHFELVNYGKGIPYQLVISESKVILKDTAQSLILRTIKGGNDAKVFTDLFAYMEHIAEWEKAKLLRNDKSKIDPSQIDFIFECDGKTYLNDEIELSTFLDGADFQAVPFSMKVVNNSPHDLYCSLYYCSENFAIYFLNDELLPSKKEVIIYDNDTLNLDDGKTIAHNFFQLIVSSEQISEFLLVEEELPIGETKVYPRKRNMAGLAELSLAGEKGLGSRMKKQKKLVNEWCTFQKNITLKGRQNAVNPDQVIQLEDNTLQILPHPSFQANVSTSKEASNTRNINSIAMITRLIEDQDVELLSLGRQTRSTQERSNLLELSEIKNEADLKENPLHIQLNTELQADETILPITFDGEHFLPIGQVHTDEKGKTHIAIHHLPEEQAITKRSIFRALKLCFLKVALKRKATDLHQLSWVDYQLSKARLRTDDIELKVAEAENILLVVHGIIGNTKAMVNFMAGNTNYDLILAFDYENLNTKIELIAKGLKEKLKNAGINEHKKITILAHSMGGLVSRYFVEYLDGANWVKHLILAGTPNAGSAMAKMPAYRDKTLTLMGFALNYLVDIPFAGKLVKVLEGSKTLTVTLEQMDKDNKEDELLENLAEAVDPKIPYSIVAGDLDAFFEKNEGAKKLMDKLLKLGGKLFYGTTPNDIAVSIESIKSVNRDRVPAPEMVEVACHHLNYFDDPAGREALNKFLR